MKYLVGHYPITLRIGRHYWPVPLRISVGGHMGLWIRWGHRAQWQFYIQPLPYQQWSRCELLTGDGCWHFEYSFFAGSHYR